MQQVLEQVRRLPARDRARNRRARVGQRGQQPQRNLDRDQLAAVLPVVLPRALARLSARPHRAALLGNDAPQQNAAPAGAAHPRSSSRDSVSCAAVSGNFPCQGVRKCKRPTSDQRLQPVTC